MAHKQNGRNTGAFIALAALGALLVIAQQVRHWDENEQYNRGYVDGIRRTSNRRNLRLV